MGCLRANCSPGAGWPEQGGLLRPKRLPHSRRRLSAGRLRRPVRHRSPNALKVRRTCHTHLVLSVLRAGSRSCWRAGVVWWSTRLPRASAGESRRAAWCRCHRIRESEWLSLSVSSLTSLDLVSLGSPTDGARDAASASAGRGQLSHATYIAV